MKIIILLIAISFSLSASAQGNSAKEKVDTAAIRKQQEEASKFITELVAKTSIKDFQAWVYENATAKNNDELAKLINGFIQQKYYQNLQAKEQPKK
jgi:hypothetical protein